VSEILIIDDEKSLCRSLQIQLKRHGHTTQLAHSGAAGIERAEAADFDLIFLDLGLPDGDGLGILHRLLVKHPDRPVVVITARQDMTATVTAMRDGAFDYIRKPFELVDILLVLQKAERLQPSPPPECPPATISSPASPHEIVGSSKATVSIVKQIGLLARTRVTVLITGESGTGKELVAQALHEAGAPSEPFVAVNCSAVVPTLFESELFGHEKGAFTGADSRRIGRLEQAAQGTLFLDEIGDMPLDLQAKLLRVLQERSFERVGGQETIPFEARVAAATNRDLETMVSGGLFREDLYFRLAVSPLDVPPLRDRKEDVAQIAQYLLTRRSRDLHSGVTAISADALNLLGSHDWPGNIRELENAITRAIALARGTTIGVDDFGFLESPNRAAIVDQGEPAPLWQVERRAIEHALAHTEWNITRAAKLLEITRTTLRKKINDHGIG
jgi:two-component system, NtrC family, response regulator AtoC